MRRSQSQEGGRGGGGAGTASKENSICKGPEAGRGQVRSRPARRPA